MQLDWENEVEVIKQGSAVSIYMLPNMVVGMGLCVPVVFSRHKDGSQTADAHFHTDIGAAGSPELSERTDPFKTGKMRINRESCVSAGNPVVLELSENESLQVKNVLLESN